MKRQLVHLRIGHSKFDDISKADFNVLSIDVLTWDDFTKRKSELRSEIYKALNVQDESQFLTTVREAIELICSLGARKFQIADTKLLVVSEDSWVNHQATDGTLIDVVSHLLSDDHWRINSQRQGVVTCVVTGNPQILEKSDSSNLRIRLLNAGVDVILDNSNTISQDYFHVEIQESLVVSARKLDWYRKSIGSSLYLTLVAFLVFPFCQAAANEMFKCWPTAAWIMIFLVVGLGIWRYRERQSY